jgi:hypothetical protein
MVGPVASLSSSMMKRDGERCRSERLDAERVFEPETGSPKWEREGRVKRGRFSVLTLIDLSGMESSRVYHS